MFEHPIKKCAFKTDVPASLLTFDPLMPENFLSFSQKLTVKRRVVKKVAAMHRCKCACHLVNCKMMGIPCQWHLHAGLLHPGAFASLECQQDADPDMGSQHPETETGR